MIEGTCFEEVHRNHFAATSKMAYFGRSGAKTAFSASPLVVRIARPTSLAIWHRGRSHRRPNRNKSPNRGHFVSLDLKNMLIFRTAGQHRRIFAGTFLQFLL